MRVITSRLFETSIDGELTEDADRIGQFLQGLIDLAWDFIPKLIIAILIFVIGWWLSKLVCRIIKKALAKGKADQTAISFIYSIVLCSLRILVIISALAELGINVTALLTAIGAATVTIGLALQDTMKDIASGVLIVINKPFKAGEFIEFEGLQGTVQKILITNTYLLTVDNKEVIIPNSRLTSDNLINYTSQDMRMLDLSYQISYNDDMTKAKDILNNLINADERFLKNPKPVVAVSKHNDSSIEIIGRVWCKTEDYWNLYYYMQEQVKLDFDKAGLNIPYSQVDVHLKRG